MSQGLMSIVLNGLALQNITGKLPHRNVLGGGEGTKVER